MSETSYARYVIVVSDHNVAELLACVQFRPQEIVMVASEKMSHQNNKQPDQSDGRSPADRLRQVLSELLPETRIRILSGGLSGSDLAQDLAWLQDKARQNELRLPPGHGVQGKCVLNITGGTKILALALMRLDCWDEIHYKDLGHSHIQIWKPGDETHVSRVQLSVPQTVTPSHLLATYADNVRADTPRSPYVDPQRLAMAEHIYRQYENDRSGMPTLLERVEALWYPARDQDVEEAIRQLLAWVEQASHLAALNEVAAASGLPPCKTPAQWLSRLIVGKPGNARLNDRLPVIASRRVEEEGVTRKDIRQWCKWLAGTWLEDYLFSVTSRLPDCQVQAHVETRRELDGQKQEDKRELDLIISRQAQLYVVEIKADIPKGHDRQALDQLDTLSRIVGKASKLLFIGPALASKLKQDEERKRNLEARAKARGINVVSSEAQLKEHLGIKV